MNVSRAVVSAGIVVVLAGCASARPIGAIDTSTATYRDRSFREAELGASSLAVLPVTADHPADTSLAERVGPRLALAIENRRICALVLRPSDVKERLVRDGVSERFLTMLAELPETGELDRETLDAMAQSTGCRYFLQASVRTGASSEVAPVDGVPHLSRAVTADVLAQLWDSSTGEVVWEGIGGGAALTNMPHNGSTEEVVALAEAGIARRLGIDPAVQTPRRDVRELHDLDHSQVASVKGENAARADAAVTGLHLFVAVLEVAGAIAEIAD